MLYISILKVYLSSFSFLFTIRKRPSVNERAALKMLGIYLSPPFSQDSKTK